MRYSGKVSLRRPPFTRRGITIRLGRKIARSRVGLQVPGRSLQPQGATFGPRSDGQVPGETHRLETWLGTMVVSQIVERRRERLTTSS